MALQDLINDAATQYGIDPSILGRFVQIESGGNPNARSGSYHGLLQLSPSEFQKYGGGDDIYDPGANLRAGAAKIAAEAQQFRDTYGREPTPTDLYLQHQQGVGGYGAHLANPDQPAWQSMYSTKEGRDKGPDWARRAIWGNVPSDVRGQYPGGVENLTSQQFVDLWRNKVEGGGAGRPAMVATAAAQPGAPSTGVLGPIGQIPTAPVIGASSIAQNAPVASPATAGGLLGALSRGLSMLPKGGAPGAAGELTMADLAAPGLQAPGLLPPMQVSPLRRRLQLTRLF
jgi:hypothetical protein